MNAPRSHTLGHHNNRGRPAKLDGAWRRNGAQLPGVDPPPVMGPSTGGPQCRRSILRNGHVPCYYICNFSCRFLNGPISHFDFKKHPMLCRLFFTRVANSISHVDFKKWPCRHVDFRGKVLQLWTWQTVLPSPHPIPPRTCCFIMGAFCWGWQLRVPCLPRTVMDCPQSTLPLPPWVYVVALDA